MPPCDSLAPVERELLDHLACRERGQFLAVDHDRGELLVASNVTDRGAVANVFDLETGERLRTVHYETPPPPLRLHRDADA